MALPFIRPTLALAAALTITGCYSDGYGYDRPAYGYYDDGYRTSYSNYYGWYGDYYYPGVGIYVYDRYGTSHRWNDGQRRYWETRRDRRYSNENWSDYRRERRDDRREWRDDRGQWRDDRRDDRRDRRDDRRGRPPR